MSHVIRRHPRAACARASQLVEGRSEAQKAHDRSAVGFYSNKTPFRRESQMSADVITWYDVRAHLRFAAKRVMMGGLVRADRFAFVSGNRGGADCFRGRP